MQQLKLVVALVLAALIVLPSFGGNQNGHEAAFTIRIENISTKDAEIASNGTRWSFALSPGLWTLIDHNLPLFTEGNPASRGLEMQAEDGDPSGLAKMLASENHTGHGIFNTPIGAKSAGPIRPGDSFEFSVSAKPGMRILMTMMFGQSNDWFYATEKPIELFDKSGQPVNSDVTSRFVLYDAGTEKDEEPGIGPNQGPRQKAVNTGEDEHGVVHKVKDSPFFSRNAELFRVTISPEAKM
jgi:hypothetical protein